MAWTRAEAEEFAALKAMVGEIHLAVIGNGAKGSSLRERTSALETATDWRHRAVYSVLPSILIALLSQLGIHLPPFHSQS